MLASDYLEIMIRYGDNMYVFHTKSLCHLSIVAQPRDLSLACNKTTTSFHKMHFCILNCLLFNIPVHNMRILISGG